MTPATIRAPVTICARRIGASNRHAQPSSTSDWHIWKIVSSCMGVLSFWAIVNALDEKVKRVPKDRIWHS